MKNKMYLLATFGLLPLLVLSSLELRIRADRYRESDPGTIVSSN